MTETIVCVPPCRSLARTRPSPAEMEFEAWPVSKLSQSDSERFGNPDIPWYCRSVSNPAFLPVRSLWV